MVFFILFGASLFSLVFRGFGGDLMVENFLTDIPGAKINSLIRNSPIILRDAPAGNFPASSKFFKMHIFTKTLDSYNDLL